MPAPWTRAYVEVYGPDGYEGRWEAEPEPGGFDEAFRDATLETLRAPRPEYPDAHAEWLDCGADLVFGFWHHGARPNGPPKHTRTRPD